MVTVSTLSWGPTLTVADLAEMADDGRRHELIDGAILVTPSPGVRHQDFVLNLAMLLRSACPDELKVLVAPLDVVLTNDTCVQPDLLVARRADLTAANLPTAPLLVVEILSPSTRMIDLTVKRDRYQRAGITSYWIIDPHEPRLTALELTDGTYSEVASVGTDDSWTAMVPYPVTIMPGQLAD